MSSAPPQAERIIKFEVTNVIYPKYGEVSPKGWYIVLGKVLEGGKVGAPIPVKGKMEKPSKGYIYTGKGTVVKNEKYGTWEFSLTNCKQEELSSAQGMMAYLKTECPHLGAVKAEAVAMRFGVDALKIMSEEPMRLREVGLTADACTVIQEWAIQETKMFLVKKWLYGKGLTQHLIQKLIAKYGPDVGNVLKTRPFSITEVEGIGFTTACNIADAMGIPKTDPGRIQAGIFHAFKEMMEGDGHTCVPQDKLITAACEVLSIGKNEVIEQAFILIDKKKIVRSFEAYEVFCNPKYLEPVE